MKTNTLRNLMFLGVIALPAAAMAGNPGGYKFGDAFTFSENGTTGLQDVNYNTSHMTGLGFTVGNNPILDDGFAQYTVTDEDGVTHFHQIIGGGAGSAMARGDDGEYFETESFVRIGAVGRGGIAVNQVVDDLRGGDYGTLASDTIIYTGADYLDPATEATVWLWQDVTDAVDVTVDMSTNHEGADRPVKVLVEAPFRADFEYSAYLHDLDGGGTRDDIVGVLNLGQAIDSSVENAADDSFLDSFQFNSTSFQMNGDATPTIMAAEVDIRTLVNLGMEVDDQDFEYDMRSGLVESTGTYTIGQHGEYTGVQAGGSGSFDPDALPGGSDPDPSKVMDWERGDKIDRVLISQAVENAGDFGFASVADRGVVDGSATDDSALSNPADYQVSFSLTGEAKPGISYNPDVDPFE